MVTGITDFWRKGEAEMSKERYDAAGASKSSAPRTLVRAVYGVAVAEKEPGSLAAPVRVAWPGTFR